MALVAGKERVPSPATGKTALVIERLIRLWLDQLKGNNRLTVQTYARLK